MKTITLSEHGKELYRYFSPRYRGLLSIRSNGVTFIQEPGEDWKEKKRKKDGIPMGVWLDAKAKTYEKLPHWARECRTLPTIEELNYWAVDSVCETTDGEICEPDAQAYGERGPSWLVALGLI